MMSDPTPLAGALLHTRLHYQFTRVLQHTLHISARPQHPCTRPCPFIIHNSHNTNHNSNYPKASCRKRIDRRTLAETLQIPRHNGKRQGEDRNGTTRKHNTEETEEEVAQRAAGTRDGIDWPIR